jgi:ArsR family transcriptional regulator, arsenate/arsenite/antimonite-responsive transcriptional repressor
MVLPAEPRYPDPMADVFDVIADPTRRDLLHLLLEHSSSGTGEVSVGEIVATIGLTQPTVSKHLKVLRDHGLVVVRDEGQHRFYRLEPAPLEHIEAWLGPFLSPDFDPAASAAYSAWAGTEFGATIGRRVAEGAHQARTVIHSTGAEVSKRLPKSFPPSFRKREP